jgi:hypothetical protein
MPIKHVVADGECISSIAYENGFYWETLWNHPENAQLKSTRKDPNVLRAGDVVHIPDLTLKEVSKPGKARHKFKIKGVPAKLRLRLMKDKDPVPESDEPGSTDESNYVDPGADAKPPEQEPRKDVPYALDIDGVIKKEGKTDGDGRIEIPLPPNARRGRLILNPGTPAQEVIPLQLGALDPIDEVSGARRRLSNLGFNCLPTGDEVTDDLEAAVGDFQQKNKLTVNGQLDQATKDKLKEVHGS